MRVDQSLVMRAQQAATGASAHKLLGLLATYDGACCLSQREPCPRTEQRARRCRHALELGLAGLDEQEARDLARQLYPDEEVSP